MDPVKALLHTSTPILLTYPPSFSQGISCLAFSCSTCIPEKRETRFKYGALPCAFRLILHLLPLRLNATTKKTPDHLMMQAVLMLIYFASGTKMSHRSISGSVAAEARLCRVGPCTDMGALRISLHTSDPCSKLLKSGRLNLH